MKTFLSHIDPLNNYINPTRSLIRLSNIAEQLPKLLLTGSLQRKIKSLKTNDLSIEVLIKNNNVRELKLAMVHLGFISHAYIWGAKTPSQILPEVLAKPWVQVANILGRPPILSYGSYSHSKTYSG